MTTVKDVIHDPKKLAKKIQEMNNPDQRFPLDIHGIVSSWDVFVKYTIFGSDQPGMYFHPSSEDDIPLIVLDPTDDITRQRHTLAHEFGHYLRHRFNGSLPDRNEQKENKFADAFASHLLVPDSHLVRTYPIVKRKGKISLDEAWKWSIAYGISLLSMTMILAYRHQAIEGDTNSSVLKQKVKDFYENPEFDGYVSQKHKLPLYRMAIDAYPFHLFSTDAHRQLQRVNNYIYNELRNEGLHVNFDEVAEITTDLRVEGKDSKFLKCKKKRFIEALGQYEIYKDLAEEALKQPSIHDIKQLHKKLYQYSEYGGGEFRNSNPVITNANVDIPDYTTIQNEVYRLSNQLDDILKKSDGCSHSEYLSPVLGIHYALTKLHPFNDGNGRVSRAFLNWLLRLRSIPLIFFTNEQKDMYLRNLRRIDEDNDFCGLELQTIKAILSALAV